jgi:cobalt/nickel transport system permease protein
MIVIDKLCYNSRLRYVNATEKFAFAMLSLCMCIASRSIVVALIVLAVNSLLTVWCGRIPLRRYWHLMLIPFAFLVLSTVAILVNFSAVPLDAYAIPIGGIYITSSKASLWLGAQLILTALASVSCLYFLSLNTTMPDILNVLQKLHVPSLMIELMMLIYRYIFVLLEIAASITTSQNSRMGNCNYKTACKSFGAMVSVLFVRSMKKASALYDSMEARCYDGRLRVLNENFPPRLPEIAAIAVFEIFLLVLVIWGKLL